MFYRAEQNSFFFRTTTWQNLPLQLPRPASLHVLQSGTKQFLFQDNDVAESSVAAPTSCLVACSTERNKTVSFSGQRRGRIFRCSSHVLPRCMFYRAEQNSFFFRTTTWQNLPLQLPRPASLHF